MTRCNEIEIADFVAAFLGFVALHILLLGLIVRDFHIPNIILYLKFIRKFCGIILGLGFIITMGKSPFF